MTLNFSGVGYGCGQRVHFEISGPSFSNFSLNLWFWCQFPA